MRFGEEETREEPYWREVEADWLVGGFLLVRREALEAAGGMDERFFLFSEETDWCYRIAPRRLGHPPPAGDDGRASHRPLRAA